LLSVYEWKINEGGYAIGNVLGRSILMHRLIMNCPQGMVVDHIDGNKLNNQKHNLRNVTNQENSMNRRDARHYNVNKNGKYVVSLTYKGLHKSCGVFDTEEEARDVIFQEKEYREFIHEYLEKRFSS